MSSYLGLVCRDFFQILRLNLLEHLQELSTDVSNVAPVVFTLRPSWLRSVQPHLELFEGSSLARLAIPRLTHQSHLFRIDVAKCLGRQLLIEMRQPHLSFGRPSVRPIAPKTISSESSTQIHSLTTFLSSAAPYWLRCRASIWNESGNVNGTSTV